jgi:hypothetical protein
VAGRVWGVVGMNGVAYTHEVDFGF